LSQERSCGEVKLYIDRSVISDTREFTGGGRRLSSPGVGDRMLSWPGVVVACLRRCRAVR